jgi:hypothetical protein
VSTKTGQHPSVGFAALAAEPPAVRQLEGIAVQEDVLRRFFLGEAGPDVLAEDLKGALVSRGPKTTVHPIKDMSVEFEVRPEHLVRACDAVLAGVIPAAQLSAIGFCLEASDRFVWDGDSEPGALVANTAADWSSPEINFPLTIENVQKFRDRLVTGRDSLRGAPVA